MLQGIFNLLFLGHGPVAETRGKHGESIALVRRKSGYYHLYLFQRYQLGIRDGYKLRDVSSREIDRYVRIYMHLIYIVDWGGLLGKDG